MFIAIGGPKAHVTLSMTGTLFQQLANLIRISSGFWWPMQYSHHLVVGL